MHHVPLWLKQESSWGSWQLCRIITFRDIKSGSIWVTEYLSEETCLCSSPIETFAGGHECLVEMGQGGRSLLDGLKVQRIAALQVLVGNGAQAVSCQSAEKNRLKAKKVDVSHKI